jgi:hypothetical protein
MVLVPIASGTTTIASDTKQDSQSAVIDAWKGALEKAQSERSGSSVNPTTTAGTPGPDVILPTPALGPQLTVPAPPDLGPLINVPAPPGQGPLINVPAPRDFGPLINVPAPQGPYVNYAKGRDAKRTPPPKEVKELP